MNPMCTLLILFSVSSICALIDGSFLHTRVVEVKNILFMTTTSSRIYAHICNLNKWFIFNLQKKKQLEIAIAG
jgi:hypothetical protein